METRGEPKSEQEGAEHRFLCYECGAYAVHKVVRSAEYVTDDGDEEFSVTSWDDYQVVQCQGCRAVGFRQVNRHSENVDFNRRTGEPFLVESVKLFPERSGRAAGVADVNLLPTDIQRIYWETLSALDAHLPVLAGMGIRALVEAVCKERAAQGGNLEERIDNLVAQGVLSQAQADLLHGLRIVGNEAAHEIRPRSDQELTAALEVAEYVLTGVYVLSQRGATLPMRKPRS